jgi:Zn-dependent protease
MELGMPAIVAVWVLPVLFAITVHEVAHGYVARALGDRTAEMLGRLTLNPIKHIDPLGTILVPGLMLLLGGFLFGWAKPVPVAMRNLRNPKRDMALVAVAGPAANLLMAVAWAVVLKVCVVYHPSFGIVAVFGALMGAAGIFINLILMALNLLPIPPLDGGRVLVGLLPEPASSAVARIEPFGLFIVIGALALGVLGRLMAPVINAALFVILELFGLQTPLFFDLLGTLRSSG